MSRDAALKALTLAGAQMLGLARPHRLAGARQGRRLRHPRRRSAERVLQDAADLGRRRARCSTAADPTDHLYAVGGYGAGHDQAPYMCCFDDAYLWSLEMNALHQLLHLIAVGSVGYMASRNAQRPSRRARQDGPHHGRGRRSRTAPSSSKTARSRPSAAPARSPCPQGFRVLEANVVTPGLDRRPRHGRLFGHAQPAARSGSARTLVADPARAAGDRRLQRPGGPDRVDPRLRRHDGARRARAGRTDVGPDADRQDHRPHRGRGRDRRSQGRGRHDRPGGQKTGGKSPGTRGKTMAMLRSRADQSPRVSRQATKPRPKPPTPRSESAVPRPAAGDARHACSPANCR